MTQFYIILEGPGGELDRRYASNEAEISNEICKLASETVFADGDIIRIVGQAS